MVFGLLFREYTIMLSNTNSHTEPLQAILNSIEKRWAKCDQDVFIAALILNPLFKLSPFARFSRFNNAGVFVLLSQLWTRFYHSPPPDEIFTELLDYLADAGTFQTFPTWCAQIERNAETRVSFHISHVMSLHYLQMDQGEPADPLKMYEGMAFSSAITPLCRLARRILSICANSASCERLFSAFELILTRLRSRLRGKAMTDLAELRLHLCDEHIRNGTAKTRLKRKTTSHTRVPTPPPSTASMADSTPPDPIPAGEPPVLSATEAGGTVSFTSIAQTLIRGLDKDEDSESNTSALGNRDKIKITDLFNFGNEYWINHTKKYATRGLNEELEMYDLIEADVEDGAQPELDGMMESLLVP
jgi:hAT family C-terminal dimerisation region